MTSSNAIVVAALTCSPALRKQIATMVQRDGLTPEQIAEALTLPLDLVIQNLPTDRVDAIAQNRTDLDGRKVESLLAGFNERAAEVMGELLDTSDSDAMRFAASKYILDTAAGLNRPKVEVNNTFQVNEMNLILEQATAAYKKQTAALDV